MGIDTPLFGLYFFDEQRGLAVGDRGVVLRTIDGGQTWERSPYPGSDEVRDVAFWDRLHGVVVGRGIATTDDGGRTWRARSYPTAGTSVPPGFRVFLQKVAITGSRSAVVCGLGGELLRTDDRGTSWEQIEIGESHALSTLTFVDRLTGFVAGQEGMWKTNDGGKRWRPIPGGPRDVFALHFFDARRGIAVGQGVGRYRAPATQTIHVTSDGGTTWQANTVSIGPNSLSAVHFPTPLAGFAVGSTHILKLTPDRSALHSARHP